MLLECLTQDYGRIGVVARGVRRERARLQRAQLEPFQPLVLDLLLRGELATLQSAETIGVPLRLLGDAGLAGLYVNELVVRLTGRQDPQPELFACVCSSAAAPCHDGVLGVVAAALRARFARGDRLRFATGVGRRIGRAAGAGSALPLHRRSGAVRCRPGTAHALRGSDLLALARTRMPDTAGLSALRVMMREVVRFHLGGGELRAWHVLAAAMSRR